MEAKEAQVSSDENQKNTEEEEAKEAQVSSDENQKNSEEEVIVSREDFGKSEYGCNHYRRRCKLRAPCCDQIYTCRHCHNEATNALSDPKERHELVRHDVKNVVCAVCDTEQQVSNICSNCGVKFGDYFCGICKFYEDDLDKMQYHCDECGICRVGGRENFFHCPKCGSCYAIGLRDNHSCIEDSMKNLCPICYEFLFDSTQQAMIMKCGHTIHIHCHEDLVRNSHHYRCPICSKSIFDMSGTWERIEEEIQVTEMPEEYRYDVSILCNDCNKSSNTAFHIFGHKCQLCNSYNTRIITDTRGANIAE